MLLTGLDFKFKVTFACYNKQNMCSKDTIKHVNKIKINMSKSS